MRRADDRDTAPTAPLGGGEPEPQQQVRAEAVMGTVVRVEVVSDGAFGAVLDEAFAWFHEVDARFSMYRTDSEMSRLARGELSESDVHADIRDVLRMCEDVRRTSRGVFNIRRHRPDGLLDPTGLVKGWSVDRAGLILLAEGIDVWSINAGGDILVHGGRQRGRPWRVGIQHPRRRDSVAKVVLASELAIATSGAYERGAHIVDPRSGAAAVDLLSVTVVGPELALADAYATAAFAMGREAAPWLATLPGYDGCVITTDDRVVWTEGFGRHLDRA